MFLGTEKESKLMTLMQGCCQIRKLLAKRLYVCYPLDRIRTVMHYSSGLGDSSLDHRRREEFPAIFYYTEEYM